MVKLIGSSIIILIQLSIQVVAAESSLALNTSNTEPYANKDHTGFQDLLAKEIFQRIGVSVTLHHVQTERALVNVNNGIDDGNLIRVAGLTRLYPNIRQVPEKLFDYDFVMFTRPDVSRNVSEQELRSSRVGHIRGWKVIEEKFKDYDNIARFVNEHDMFESLNAGKIDIAIYEKWRGLHLIKELGINNIKMNEPPLISGQGMYIYLHRRHESLIPKIANSIRNIKQDGTYQKIYENAFKPYLE